MSRSFIYEFYVGISCVHLSGVNSLVFHATSALQCLGNTVCLSPVCAQMMGKNFFHGFGELLPEELTKRKLPNVRVILKM